MELSSFISDKSGITLAQTDNYGSTWSTSDTRYIKATANSNVTLGDYKLTFTMLVRFPKLKKTDGEHLLVNGQKQYFGPYTCSTTVDLKVIDIIVKRRVAGQGDFVKISDTQNVPSVIVGQKIELKVEVMPNDTEFTNTWIITGGKPIKNYQPTKAKAEVINLANTDYTQKTIAYYNTASGNTTTKTNVTIGGKNKEKNVTFAILRPEINYRNATLTERNPKVCIWYYVGEAAKHLSFGGTTDPNIDLIYSDESPGITWKIRITPPQNGNGQIAYVSLGKSILTAKIGQQQKTLAIPEYALVSVFPYSAIGNVTAEQRCGIFVASNTPGVDLSIQNLTNIKIEDNYKTYFMYKPTGGIGVTLVLFTWGWEE
jgi:hypothetical protein